MTRREIREHLFCMLFETGFHDEHEFEEQYLMYWSTKDDEPSEEEHEEIKSKLKAVKGRISDIDPLIEKNGTLLSPATARASSVFPVPGLPTKSTPFGMRAPS